MRLHCIPGIVGTVDWSSKEEGMRIAVDEINAFLLTHEMLIYLVVFGRGATNLGSHIYPDLESYIDENYVKDRRKEEYEEFSYEYGRRIMNRVPVFPESGIKEVEIPEEAVDVDCFDEHKSALEHRTTQYFKKFFNHR